jgi:hypothetical protein
MRTVYYVAEEDPAKAEAIRLHRGRKVGFGESECARQYRRLTNLKMLRLSAKAWKRVDM